MEPSGDLSFLNCYICFEELKKPKMCPSCSKVACEKCLRSWVEQRRPECPHCRKIMALNSFVECERFISDIKHVVKAIDQNQRVKQKCPQHKIQMTYYCEDCHIPICSDCGMFGSKHKQHKLTHLKTVYQTFKNRILNQLTNFDKRIEGYRQNGYQIKVEMQKLVMQMGQRKGFIEKYFIAIIERLEQEFQEKQERVSEKFDKNAKEIEFLESFRDNIYSELEKSSENELITKCEELIGYVQSVYGKGPQFSYEQYPFDTIHEIVPQYNEFSYSLRNYPARSKDIIYSDAFVKNGIEWKLKIYPQGNQQAEQTHLSVFLEMSKGYANGNKYEYKLQLVNRKSSKDSIVREYSSNFDIGECWGYNHFIPISQLNEEFLSEKGDLLFKVCVRNPSYRSLVRDQQEYIVSLENKLKSSSEHKSKKEIGTLSGAANFHHTHNSELKQGQSEWSGQYRNQEEDDEIPDLHRMHPQNRANPTKHWTASDIVNPKQEQPKPRRNAVRNQQKEQQSKLVKLSQSSSQEEAAMQKQIRREIHKKQKQLQQQFNLDSFLSLDKLNKASRSFEEKKRNGADKPHYSDSVLKMRDQGILYEEFERDLLSDHLSKSKLSEDSAM